MNKSTALTGLGLLALGSLVGVRMATGPAECPLCQMGSAVKNVFVTPKLDGATMASVAFTGDDKPGTTTSTPKATPAKPAAESAVPTEMAKKAAAEAAKTDAKSSTTKDAKTETLPMKMPEKTETAMFGGGCFWGVEASFRRVPGVLATEVGFAGGHVANASYKAVCYTDTGHAEVVRVVFDPAKVSYDKLLDVFFKVHDPTQVNRQGPDTGEQYRTVIFTYSPEQKAAAEKKKADLDAAKKFKRPIATQIVAAELQGPAAFGRAEDYHQQYLEKRGLESCHIPLPEAEDEPATTPKKP